MYVFSFHFEMRVASPVRRVVYLCLTGIDNFPVHLVQKMTEELACSFLIVITRSMNTKSWIFDLTERADFGVSKHFLDSNAS